MKKVLRLIGAALLSLMITLSAALPSFAYEVKPGDTLDKIAKEHGMTVSEITARNSSIADKDLIYVGQSLDLGEKETKVGVGTNLAKIDKRLTASDRALLKEMFDAKFYAKENPDVVKVYGDTEDRLFEHFLTYGLWETRELNKDFNVNAYASAYGDLHKAFGDNVMAYYRHYDEHGKTEGRTLTTIDKALTVVDKIKSVSPLNKADSEEKVFDTIVAEKKASENTGSKDPTPTSASNLNSWAKSVVKSYEDALISFTGYLDSIDGSGRLADVKAYLDLDENKPGSGKYARALDFAADEVIDEAEALMLEHPEKADEIQDKLDAFKDVNKDITMDYVQLKIKSFPEGLAYFNWGAENMPNEQAFKDTYDAAHAAWLTSYNEQNFTYVGQNIDGKIGVYGYASVDIYIENERVFWEDAEPNESDYVEVGQTAYTTACDEHVASEPKWPDDYPYGEGCEYEDETAALSAYDADHLEWEESEPNEEAFRNDAMNEYYDAHIAWEDAEPKAENYFIAGYGFEETMLAEKEEWLTNNPEPIDNSEDLYEDACDAFADESFEKIKTLGDYVVELTSMFGKKVKKLKK